MYFETEGVIHKFMANLQCKVQHDWKTKASFMGGFESDFQLLSLFPNIHFGKVEKSQVSMSAHDLCIHVYKNSTVWHNGFYSTLEFP